MQILRLGILRGLFPPEEDNQYLKPGRDVADDQEEGLIPSVLLADDYQEKGKGEEQQQAAQDSVRTFP
jgi:hypothetical protein